MIDFSEAFESIESPEGSPSTGLSRRSAIEALSTAERLQVTSEVLRTFVARVEESQQAGGELILLGREAEVLRTMGEVLLDEAQRRYAEE